MYVWAIVERERGWGQRVDGYVCSEIMDVGQKYVDKAMSGRSRIGPVPDYYVSYEYTGKRMIELTKLSKSKGNPGIYFMD